jgi:hypothetical protein
MARYCSLCFIAILCFGKFLKCAGHATLDPATNANMDFKFWREDATLEQQKVQHADRPLPLQDISLFGKPISNLSGGGGEETRMEDHMNEVMTDQAFVAVVKRGGPLRTTATTIATIQSVRLVQARRHKPTTRRPLNRAISSSCCGITTSTCCPRQGAALYRTQGGLSSANVPLSCLIITFFTSSPSSWPCGLFSPDRTAVVANDPGGVFHTHRHDGTVGWL